MRQYLAGRNDRSHSPEDLAQEVFLRVWEHRGRYRPGMSVPSYLLGFAMNVAREQQRRARYEKVSGSRRLGRVVDSHTPPSSQAESVELVQAIRSLLAKLPPKQRQAVELVYLNEMPIREAAKMMNCPVESLRMNISRARRKIESWLRGNAEIDSI